MEKVRYFLLCGAASLCCTMFVENKVEASWKDNLKNSFEKSGMKGSLSQLKVAVSNVAKTGITTLQETGNNIKGKLGNARESVANQVVSSKAFLENAKTDATQKKNELHASLTGASAELKVRIANEYEESTKKLVTKAEEYKKATEAEEKESEHEVQDAKAKLSTAVGAAVEEAKLLLSRAELKLQTAKNDAVAAAVALQAANEERIAAEKEKNALLPH